MPARRRWKCERYFIFSARPLVAERKPAAALNPSFAPRIGEERGRFDDPVDFGRFALWAERFCSLLAAPLPHDATARQRNGWPSLNRAERVSLAMFPTSSAGETCMCVQCGCVGVCACCLTGPSHRRAVEHKRLRLPNRLAPPPRFLDNPTVTLLVASRCLTHLLILVGRRPCGGVDVKPALPVYAGEIRRQGK